MARGGITEFQVFKAADELALVAGGEPSNRDVLEKLGSGSMTTITTHMKRWRELHPQYQAQSEGFSDPLLNAVRVLRASLLTDAQTYVDEHRAAFDEKIVQADAQFERAQESYINEAAVTKKLQDELSNAHTQLATYRLDLKTETERRVRAETTAENLALQLSELHDKLETLGNQLSMRDRELTQAQSALSERDKALYDVNNTLAAAVDERDQFSVRNAELTQQVVDRQSALDESTRELKQCQVELEKHSDTHQQLTKTLADLTKTQRDQELRIAQLIADKALMHDRAEYLHEQLSEERQARSSAEQALTAARDRFEKQLIDLAENAQNTARKKASTKKSPK